jgi:hypothetical protein
MAEDETGAGGKGIEVLKHLLVYVIFDGNREGLLAKDRSEGIDLAFLVDFDVEEKTLIKKILSERGHGRFRFFDGRGGCCLPWGALPTTVPVWECAAF